MKSLHVLLEEIKGKTPELFIIIEKKIHGYAKKIGIQIQELKTEHPPKPPHNT
jgi:hypothetical protein